MESFDFFRRTRIIFGQSADNEVGQIIKYQGGTRVLLLHGEKAAIKYGIVERIGRTLDRSGLKYFSKGGIKSNPHIDKVYECIEFCLSNSINYILAVGGGSVIDTAKIVAAGVFFDGDIWDMFEKHREPYRSLPLGCVLTVPASGSECSNSSSLMREKDGRREKLIAYSNSFVPEFAILNPDLTLSLSPRVTASGCVDMINHVLEGYFSNSTGVLLSDKLCEAVLSSIIELLPQIYEDPNNIDARANLMLAATLSHNDICCMGRKSDNVITKLANQLVVENDCPFGDALAVLIPAWMEYVVQFNPLRIAQFSNRVFGIAINFEDPKITAYDGIKALRAFFKNVKLPCNFVELGIKTEAIADIVNALDLKEGKTLGSFVPLDAVACEAILSLAANYCEGRDIF